MHFIGADCSGIKTTILLANENKEVINSISAGPACYGEMSMNVVIDIIDAALCSLLKDTGVNALDCYAVFSIDYAEHSSALDVQFERLLSGRFAGFTVVNDSVAAFNAVFHGDSGIAIIAGTGSIAYGQDEQGNMARCGGYGRFASDEGSGYWLGQEAIRLFYSQCDGRMQASILHSEMCHNLQICDEFSMMNIVERRFAADRYAVEQMQTVLATAALKGDKAAQRIYKKAAHHLADLAYGVRKQLGLTEATAMKVSYFGSVFAAGEIIINPFEQALGDMNFELVTPDSTMLAEGALNIAYKQKNK